MDEEGQVRNQEIFRAEVFGNRSSSINISSIIREKRRKNFTNLDTFYQFLKKTRSSSIFLPPPASCTPLIKKQGNFVIEASGLLCFKLWRSEA